MYWLLDRLSGSRYTNGSLFAVLHDKKVRRAEDIPLKKGDEINETNESVGSPG